MHIGFIGNFDEIAQGLTIEVLKSEDNKNYQVYDPTRLHEAITDVKLPGNIGASAARIIIYCENIFERLDSVVCGSLKLKTQNTLSGF